MNTLDKLLLEEMQEEDFLSTALDSDGELIDSLEETDPNSYSVKESKLISKNSIYKNTIPWTSESFI